MLILYDGYCPLCSRSVQWIIRNDRRGRFSFEPLQHAGPPGIPKQAGNARKESREPEGRTSPPGDTVLLLMEGKTYDRSAAFLQIAIRLRFPWPLLGVFFMIPRVIRDVFYRLVARNRRTWFGERSTCYIAGQPK